MTERGGRAGVRSRRSSWRAREAFEQAGFAEFGAVLIHGFNHAIGEDNEQIT